MTREEYLKGLEEALVGEVPAGVIRENISYYGTYIDQERAKGRNIDEIVEEIGGPRIVAQTIIDSCEAAGETGDGNYGDAGAGADAYGGYGGQGGYGSQSGNRGSRSGGKIHYFDLSKWYWRILIPVIIIVVLMFFVSAVGGIFYLLARFAGPLLLIYLVYRIFTNNRR